MYSGAGTFKGVFTFCPSAQRYSNFCPALMMGQDSLVQYSVRVPQRMEISLQNSMALTASHSFRSSPCGNYTARFMLPLPKVIWAICFRWKYLEDLSCCFRGFAGFIELYNLNAKYDHFKQSIIRVIRLDSYFSQNSQGGNGIASTPVAGRWSLITARILWSPNNQRDCLVYLQRSMNRVEDLIMQALTTAHNNQQRQQAENTIFGLLHENPADFFATCTSIVVSENKPEQIRQSAASVMKAILAKSTQNGQYFWDLCPLEMRTKIKEVLLSNLISPNVLVMRAGANVIAQIAAIEIPRGEWLEIVSSLADNSIHEDLNIRRASVTTLGFICEELKNVQTIINKQTCEQILASLLICLRENGEIVEIALTALRESVIFLRHILENEGYCNQVFEYVFPLLATDYRSKVYEFLFEFGRYSYHMLGNYIALIAQASVQHIDQRNDNAILALELWDTIGTEYLRRVEEANERVFNERSNVRNFIEEMQDTILSHVMASILILTKQDIDFPELRESAVKTLTTFVSCCGRQLFDKVTDGVSRVLQSPNPGERQASALLFSCLVEYKDRDYILQCFTNGFTHLYKLIEDSEDIVRKNTLNGFVTLSQCFPEVFLNNTNIYDIFQHLLKLSTAPDEVTQILTLSILINVSDSLKDNQSCQVVIDPDNILQTLIAIFTENLTRDANKEANEKIIGIIMNIVMATKKRQVVAMLLCHLTGLYTRYSTSKIRDQEIVLSQILTIVHTTVLAMVKFPTDGELRRKVYDLLDLHINIHGAEVQGIHLIGAIALCFKRDFLQDHFEKYWSVVIQGLEMIDQKPTFRSALTCIQDISRNNQHKLVGKLTPVFQKLIQYMHNNIERDLKTEILRCFGDLTLGLKNYSEMYIDSILQICEECCTAVQKLSELQSERQYAEELKEALIEMYHCVVFAVNEQNGSINKKMANHFPIICTFIVKTCDVKYSPTVDYVKNCLYLVFDAALFYARSKDQKDIVNQIITSQEISSLVETIRKYKDKAGVSDILAFIEDKLKNQRR